MRNFLRKLKNAFEARTLEMMTVLLCLHVTLLAGRAPRVTRGVMTRKIEDEKGHGRDHVLESPVRLVERSQVIA